MTRVDVVRRTIAVALMSLTATAIFFRLFGVTPVLLRMWPVIIMCCVGYALGTAGGRRVQRGTGAMVALFTTLLGTLALGAMTIPNAAGRISVSSLAGGLVEGIGMLLGDVVPAEVNAETITAGILLTAYGAMVGCLLVTTSVPASSIVPPLFVFLGGLMLSQGSSWSAVPFAAAFVVSVTAALALLPATQQQNAIEDGAEFATVEKVPRPGRTMRVATVAVGGVVIALLASLLGPLTGLGSMRPAFDPHKKENFRPDADLDGDNPVSRATKWQTLQRKQPEDLFTVSGPNIPASVNWVVQAKFDGVTWSSLTTFDNVETGIPYEGPREKFTVTGATGFATGPALPGPWLPATYRPTNVTGVPARADAEGTVIAGDDTAAEKQYSVDYRALAVRNLGVLDTVQPAEQPEYGTLRELPVGFSEQLTFFAAAVMANASTPYAKVQALADVLSAAPYTEQVNSIDNGLDVNSLYDVVLGSKRGTQAQFATAFAMLARSQGYPVRLVVGYAVKGKSATRTVSSKDVIVYPEVQFTKLGWVPFAPGPSDAARGVPVLKRFKEPKQDKPEPTPEPTVEPTPTPSPTPEEQKPEQSRSMDLTRLLLPLLLVVLLMVWPVFVAWRRNAVRAKYRRGDPDDEVVGAWAYTRGAKQRVGQPLDDTVSAARYADDPQTSPKLAGLATAVETAMYAPEHLSPEQAGQAWDLADDVVSGAVKQASWGRKLRWWLVPWWRGPRT